MTTRTMTLVTLAAALGSGVIGGAFFAFSSFVMRALGRLAPAEGIRAMQSINIVVINPVFLGVFVGTALVCAALAVFSLRSWSDAGSGLRLAGCLAYVVGTFAVTMLCNVPRNDALSAMPADAADTAAYWARYLGEWTWWNHVRTVAGAAGAVLLVAAQLVGRGAP
jgi:uncharacterized membrane protein